jgi:DNA-binding SARP family transcriptional activator
VAGSKPTGTRLRLLDAFELVCDGVPVALPMSAQRFVAFLAIHDRPLLRSYVAGTLWLETSEARAHANLRSTLWRLHRCNRGLVDVRGQQLRLSAGVEVDLREVERLARSALDDTARGALELPPAALGGDLLPDWYDDWVLMEREHFRQVRLHALDALCERLTRAGRLGEALEVGLVALAGEPLRESAHRAVIRVHLAEGNPGEAIRQYRFCRHLLGEHLGVEPSHQMEELIGTVTMWRRSRDIGAA